MKFLYLIIVIPAFLLYLLISSFRTHPLITGMVFMITIFMSHYFKHKEHKHQIKQRKRLLSIGIILVLGYSIWNIWFLGDILNGVKMIFLVIWGVILVQLVLGELKKTFSKKLIVIINSLLIFTLLTFILWLQISRIPEVSQINQSCYFYELTDNNAGAITSSRELRTELKIFKRWHFLLKEIHSELFFWYGYTKETIEDILIINKEQVEFKWSKIYDFDPCS